jgi:hypothetical protein
MIETVCFDCVIIPVLVPRRQVLLDLALGLQGGHLLLIELHQQLDGPLRLRHILQDNFPGRSQYI